MASIKYLTETTLLSSNDEFDILRGERRTCLGSSYPFGLFPKKSLSEISFEPITIFYGSNGSGKSTLLNIIAERTHLIRHSAFSSSAFFKKYIGSDKLKIKGRNVPEGSQILTSDDVTDYLLNMRYLNDGINARQEELFDEWLDRKYANHRFRSLDDYDHWKDVCDASSKSMSQYTRERVMRHVDMQSNGESALRYFEERITENCLYLIDEPENSLAFPMQQTLADYIAASARFYGCQFVLATHSPAFLAIENALIYDLDDNPVSSTKKWTELDNMKACFDFFYKYKDCFMSRTEQ